MKIQCKLGPAQPVVGGHTYDFRMDEHGRYVADVHNLIHQAVMLSVEHYVAVPEIVAASPSSVPEAAPVPPAVPAPAAEAETPPAAAETVEEKPGVADEEPAAPPASPAQNFRGRRGKRRG